MAYTLIQLKKDCLSHFKRDRIRYIRGRLLEIIELQDDTLEAEKALGELVKKFGETKVKEVAIGLNAEMESDVIV